MSNINERKVTVAARVPLDLATELGRMAEAGNRTLSREIWAAVAEHVDGAGRGDAAPAVGVEDFSAMTSSSRKGEPPPAMTGGSPTLEDSSL